MRIASVSDLHTDFAENREAMIALSAEIHRRGADLVICAGDVSHKNDRIERALLALREVAPRVAYVPGNHDIWSSVPRAALNPAVNTWTRYREELRALCEGTGAHYLPAGPLVMGTTAIVGTCGWYDYSFLEPWVREQLGEATIATKQYGEMAWSDAFLTAFRDEDGRLMTDAEVAGIMNRELEAQLTEVEARADVTDVVAVTHHQPFRDVVFRTGSLPWEFFCAFMGNVGMGEVILRGKKVRAAIYGHSHVVAEHRVQGLRVFGTALGYPKERKRVTDDATLVATRVGWVEL